MTKTPLRASFLGGGSDLPSYYRAEEGAVLTTAIGKYIYINVKRKFDDAIRVSYFLTETVDSVQEIRHDLVRAALTHLGIDQSIEITSISDLPSNGTGMGSSSAYVVGLLNALYHHMGHAPDAEELASKACMIELDMLRKPIGKQDQYIAAYGGLNFITFRQDDTVTVEPVHCPRLAELQANLLLLYTGINRSADLILREQSETTKEDAGMKWSIRQMVAMAHTLRAQLIAGDLSEVGRLLHEAWMIKSRLTKNTSNGFIDECYKTARENDAVGGKLLGAGGGGFLLLYADPEAQEKIKAALPQLRPLNVSLEASGSRLVYRD